MNAGLARASVAACVAAAVATLALMAWAASWSWSGLAFMVSLMAWCVSPYVPLGFASRKPRASRRSAVALLVTVMVLLCSLAGGRRRRIGAVMHRLAQCAGVGHTHREAEQPHEQHLGCPSAETSAIAEHG